MRNKLIIGLAIFLFASSPVWAGNFIKYDSGTGEILQSWHSIDAVVMGISKDPCVIRITYDQYKALNKYSIVKDGKLATMTDEEKEAKDTEDAESQAKAEAAAAMELTLEKLVAALVDKSVVTVEEIQTADEKGLLTEVDKNVEISK